MLELIVFDCDGVLFDSHRANVEYYNAVLERIGTPRLTPEWERRVHFLASSQVWDELFGAGSVRAEEARQAARGMDYGPFFQFMLPVPGLDETLAALQQDYRLAMATNRGSTVPEILRRFGLDRFLEFAVGVKDVERPKPHPDMLQKCLRHFAVAPAAAMYVGDAESDRDAARAAGMHFVAVGEAQWPAARIPRLRDLPALLQRLSDGAAASAPATKRH